ncbi:MAG: hypothetical protein ACRBBP_09505 [Bdellovibrionales bacterium]
MKFVTRKKILTLLPLLALPLTFQNCGEEGFISLNGSESYGSFEEVYPSMDAKGDIRVKYEQQDKSYLRSREYLRDTDRIYSAVGTIPSTAFPTITSGGGVTTSGGGITTGGGATPVLEEPGFAGAVTNYYSGIFKHMKSAAASIKNSQRYLYPDRYYGVPKYQSIFESQGLGIVRVDLKIGASSNLKVNASFYQYKADYFREKAVVFVLGDKLFSEEIGARKISLNQQHLTKLAKKGYLVVHLKPGALKDYDDVPGNARCHNLEKAIYLGVQEVRSAVGDIVKRADFFGANPEKMFIAGFGVGGTLAAYSAFLDTNEAIAKFGKGIYKVPDFNNKSLFQGVGISGGGILDRSILNGASKARVVTIHGGCDQSVKVDGSQMYGCMRNGAQINPISSKQLTDFAAGYLGASASVLNCSANADTKDVRSIETQLSYFATYFHNIMGAGDGTVFGNLSNEISSYYQSLYCSTDGRDGDQHSCSFPAPLIHDVNYGTCEAGPCSPPPPVEEFIGV